MPHSARHRTERDMPRDSRDELAALVRPLCWATGAVSNGESRGARQLFDSSGHLSIVLQREHISKEVGDPVVMT